MLAQPSSSRRWFSLDRRIYALAFARAINTMGFSVVLPFLAIYLYTERHIPASRIGAIYTLSGITGALTQVLAGELTDRYGRRRIMVVALVSRAAILAAMGVAIERHAAFALLGALVVANAILRSLFEPAAFAAVTDLAPLEDRVEAFGLQRIGVNVGWAAGPALGAYLASGSYGKLFFLAVPAMLTAALVCGRIRDAHAFAPSHRFSFREFANLRHERVLLVYLAFTLVAMILVAQLYSTLSIYSTAGLHLRKMDLGHFYTINGVLVVLFQLPAVRIIERMGKRVAVIVGPLAYAASYTAMGLCRSAAGVMLCVAGVTSAELFFLPAQQTLASELADPNRQGRAMGLYGLTFAAGQSFGPLVGGFAVDHFIAKPLEMWGVLSLLGVVAACGYALIVPSGVRHRARPVPSTTPSIPSLPALAPSRVASSAPATES
jgi:MFS family permease